MLFNILFFIAIVFIDFLLHIRNEVLEGCHKNKLNNKLQKESPVQYRRDMEDFMKVTQLISGMFPVEIKSNSNTVSKGEGESN